MSSELYPQIRFPSTTCNVTYYFVQAKRDFRRSKDESPFFRCGSSCRWGAHDWRDLLRCADGCCCADWRDLLRCATGSNIQPVPLVELCMETLGLTQAMCHTWDKVNWHHSYRIKLDNYGTSTRIIKYNYGTSTSTTHVPVYSVYWYN